MSDIIYVQWSMKYYIYSMINESTCVEMVIVIWNEHSDQWLNLGWNC